MFKHPRNLTSLTSWLLVLAGLLLAMPSPAAPLLPASPQLSTVFGPPVRHAPSPPAMQGATTANQQLQAQIASLQARLQADVTAQTALVGQAQAAQLVAQAQATSLSAQNAGLSAQVAAAAPTIWGQPFVLRFSDASPSGPHLFFAHYQTSGGDYGKSYNPPPFNDGGTSPSVAQAGLDVSEAAAISVDGFALDLGGTTNSYAAATENMLTAGDQWTASQAGKPNPVGVAAFRSFVLFDLSTFGPQNAETIEPVLLRSFKHPSYYKYKGAYFVGTYGGEGPFPFVIGLWKQVIADMKAQGYPIYFVPGFNPTDAAGGYLTVNAANPTAAYQSQAAGLLTQIPAQGVWAYGNGLGLPLLVGGSSIPQSEGLAKVAAANGLSLMASVSSNYQGLDKPGHWYNEYNGGETPDREWRSIIGSQNAAWVQFVTWNDYGEYSRLTNANENAGCPWPYAIHSDQDDYYLSTLGQQSLNLYYAQWYKTGVQPTFANDNLWAFNRIQSRSLDVPGDEARKIGYVTTDAGQGADVTLAPDTLYIATGEPSQATLTVTNGSKVFTCEVPAGLYFSRVGPFVPGPVTYSVVRHGQAMGATLVGHTIVSSATVYNWSQWSGFAHD